MVATARSDLFDGLVRKIGYSVGLEFLSAHVQELAQTYFAQRSLNGADWRYLVQDCWGRKAQSAEQHIADVYSQLGLLRRHNSAVHVLPALEVLSILFSGPPDTLRAKDASEEGDADAKAVRFVLALKVIEADGDIFLNALASDFNPQLLGMRLKQMIRHKRRVVSPLFKQAGSVRRIMAAISIRNQTESEGKPRRQTYAERSRAFMSGGASIGQEARSAEWWDSEIFISDDYLEKVCLTRGNWAEEFSFFDRRQGRVTALGRELLRQVGDLGLAFESSDLVAYAFWPYCHDLARIGLTPELLGIRGLMSWNLTAMLAGLFAGDRETFEMTCVNTIEREDLAKILGDIQRRYREASRRGTLRHDLPIFIAEPVVAHWFATAGQSIPNMREFVRTESQRKDRLVDFVMIHGTEGGLRLMRPKDGHGE